MIAARFYQQFMFVVISDYVTIVRTFFIDALGKYHYHHHPKLAAVSGQLQGKLGLSYLRWNASVAYNIITHENVINYNNNILNTLLFRISHTDMIFWTSSESYKNQILLKQTYY